MNQQNHFITYKIKRKKRRRKSKPSIGRVKRDQKFTNRQNLKRLLTKEKIDKEINNKTSKMTNKKMCKKDKNKRILHNLLHNKQVDRKGNQINLLEEN